MTDVFTKLKRSEVMSKIKSSKNIKTEILFMNILRKGGVHGWRRSQIVYGKPDFIFRKYKVAIFIDGCFWHKCSLHFTMPKSNRIFWRRKIAANVLRDKKVKTVLMKKGWTVLRYWEHELKKPIDKCLRKLHNIINKIGVDNHKWQKG